MLFREDGYAGGWVKVPCSQIPEAAETPDSWRPKVDAEAGASARDVSDERNFLSISVTNVFVPQTLLDTQRDTLPSERLCSA